MIKKSKLHQAAIALCDDAEPISLQHSAEPDEYVVPREELEDLQTALVNLALQEATHDQ